MKWHIVKGRKKNRFDDNWIYWIALHVPHTFTIIFLSIIILNINPYTFMYNLRGLLNLIYTNLQSNIQNVFVVCIQNVVSKDKSANWCTLITRQLFYFITFSFRFYFVFFSYSFSFVAARPPNKFMRCSLSHQLLSV